MKQTTLVIILLTILMIFGWISVLNTDDSELQTEYENHMDLAETCMDKGLYQRAIREYTQAIETQKTKSAIDDRLYAYSLRYEETGSIYDDYVSALKEAISDYPEETDYIIQLSDIYFENDDYVLAYKMLDRLVSNGTDDAEILEYLYKAKYSFARSDRKWENIKPCINGLYAVYNAGYWSYVDETGSNYDDGLYLFASSCGENGTILVSGDSGSNLVDEDGVLVGIPEINPEDAGIFSEGLIPIKFNGSYSYYDSFGDYSFGNYQFAGSFKEGVAAIEKDGSWHFIDSKGDYISDDRYEDIILSIDGSCIFDGIKAVKSNGKYSLIDDGAMTGSWDDMDVITDDGIIAVKSGNLWGYVDLSGKEVIAPSFQEAKSFSNGLAAVYNGELWGFIDESGKVVIDYQFEDADYFNDSMGCMIRANTGLWHMISLYNP